MISSLTARPSDASPYLAFWCPAELDEDMAKPMTVLRDAFYSPDMPVTRYTYLPSGVDKETYNAADAAVFR